MFVSGMNEHINHITSVSIHKLFLGSISAAFTKADTFEADNINKYYNSESVDTFIESKPI